MAKLLCVYLLTFLCYLIKKKYTFNRLLLERIFLRTERNFPLSHSYVVNHQWFGTLTQVNGKKMTPETVWMILRRLSSIAIRHEYMFVVTLIFTNLLYTFYVESTKYLYCLGLVEVCRTRIWPVQVGDALATRGTHRRLVRLLRAELQRREPTTREPHHLTAACEHDAAVAGGARARRGHRVRVRRRRRLR